MSKETETIEKYYCNFCDEFIEEKIPFEFKGKHFCFKCREELVEKFKNTF